MTCRISHGRSVIFGILIGIVLMVVVAASQPLKDGHAAGQTEGGRWQLLATPGRPMSGFLLDTSTGDTWYLVDNKRRKVVDK